MIKFITEKAELQKSKLSENVKIEKEKQINAGAKRAMDEISIIMSMLAGHKLLELMVEENEADV
jgi:hypothetical protein